MQLMASWTLELDIKVGHSSWTLKLDIKLDTKVGHSSYLMSSYLWDCGGLVC